MGILDSVRDQFLDVIEYTDHSSRLIVYKFQKESRDDALKQGSRIIVREGQYAVFLREGQIADVLPPGSYYLTADNLPVLSGMHAIPYLFVSPVICDVYYVSTRQFIDNKWATKNPILKKDEDFGMVRIRAFGKFSFRIENVSLFMTEVFGSMRIVMTYDIVQYLSSMVTEAFSVIAGESRLSVLEFAAEYRKLSEEIGRTLNREAEMIGVRFSNVLIESISLPDEVEKLIDEQSGIGMARQDMASFLQYQTARAMREASAQETGPAGIGAGLAIGQRLAAETERNAYGLSLSEKAGQLRQLKELLDEEILTAEEFEEEKKKILMNRQNPSGQNRVE